MNSQLDDVNELLKLKQGDLVRLAHIKKTLESRNVLYISDSKYLRELTKAYLEDHTGERFSKYNSYDYPEYSNRLKETSDFEPKLEPENKGEASEKDNESKIIEPKTKENKNAFCGNCGNAIKDENFCPKCGYSLHTDESLNVVKEEVENDFKKEPKPKKNKKLTVIIILTVVIMVSAIAIGSQMLNNVKIDDVINTTPTNNVNNISDSKCGAGTVFDDASNSCVLEGSVVVETNSKCGAGTVFDDASNSCVLEGSVVVETNSKCGAGTVFDDASNSCVLEGSVVVETNSKCGAGTVFDDASNSCVLG